MRRGLFLLLLLALAFGQSGLEREVFEAANAARVEAGLKPLAFDPGLYQAARAHAEDMLRRRYFGHVGPGGPGLLERLVSAGVYALKVAENLYQLEGPYLPADFARRAVEGWLESPGHRRNLLDPGFDRMAVAVLAGDGRYVAVQEFAYEPFDLRVSATRGTGVVARFELRGQSPAPLLVVVADRRFLAFAPGRVDAVFELPQGVRPKLLYRQRGIWYELGARQRAVLGIELEQKKVERPGFWVELAAPPGTYVLGYGDRLPRVFAEGALPGRIFAPLTWRGLWIGRGGVFAFRIPLRP